MKYTVMIHYFVKEPKSFYGTSEIKTHESYVSHGRCRRKNAYLLDIYLVAFACITSVCLISQFRFGPHTTQLYSNIGLIKVLYLVILTSLVEDFKVVLTYPSLSRAQEHIKLMCFSHLRLVCMNLTKNYIFSAIFKTKGCFLLANSITTNL